MNQLDLRIKSLQ